MATEVEPSDGGPGNFKNLTTSQSEEDAFDFVKWRYLPKPNGVVASVAHLVKGSLGARFLAGHVAYKKSGYMVGIPMQFVYGVYIAYCLHILIKCTQIIKKRTRVPSMTYSDVGEAALAIFPNPKVARWSRPFRYFIDIIICVDLLGSCAVYQIMISTTVKQLVENRLEVELEGIGPGYPHLRVYLVSLCLPMILICLIIHLKWLAPLSFFADIIIVFCVFLAMYYAFVNNPRFENMVVANGLYEFLEYTGMSVYSMSSAGVVIAIENAMKDPKKIYISLYIGYVFIILCSLLTALFGYVAFLDKSESPIILNFPLTIVPIILKVGIAAMICVTHALNFWVPFNICFYYLAIYHKTNLLTWELIYRTTFVIVICVVAVVFPAIDALMGVLGALCSSNMSFICPNMIYLLVVWERPGLGKYKWRLWRASALTIIGIFICVAGTIVNLKGLMKVLGEIRMDIL